jgi:hypothetical protein
MPEGSATRPGDAQPASKAARTPAENAECVNLDMVRSERLERILVQAASTGAHRVPVMHQRQAHSSQTRSAGPVDFMADRIAPRGPSATGLTVRFLASDLEVWPTALGRVRALADLIASP